MGIRRIPITMIEGLSDLINAASFPVGSVVFSPKGTVFPGFLALEGGTFLQSAYPDLYAYLGSNVLPDYRDRVLRHAGTLAGAAFTTQEDALQQHAHDATFQTFITNQTFAGGGGAVVLQGAGTGNLFGSSITPSSARIGTETRVKAAIGKYLIKAASIAGNTGTVDMLALAGSITGKVDKSEIVGALVAGGNGRIIEKGSNANGYFTRFADGTLLCRKVVVAGPGSAWTSAYWAYPSAFSEVPNVIASAHASNGGWNRSPGGEAGLAGFTFYRASYNGGSANNDMAYAQFHTLAVGRWF